MVTQTNNTPMLIAQTGPLKGQQWVFSGDLLVGRDVACDVIVPDRQVSRHHARLLSGEEGFILEDLHSKNGTHLNGQAIDGAVHLQDGDVIQIALAQEFVFVSADATVPLVNEGPVDARARRRLLLDSRSRRVWIGDSEVLPSLSVAQFRVLEMLYNQEGQVVSRERLMETVWGAEGAMEVSGQALDALIRRLRYRLADVDASHEFILTVRGHGLRLDNPDK